MRRFNTERDYRIRSSAGAVVTGGSAFNVKAESSRLGDFTEAETRALLAQHTAETGQDFTAAALDAVWRQTRGQPWLVNALCQRACFRRPSGRDRSRPITAADIFDAQEQLIPARETHLDQLADKLGEERVRRVVGPLLRGDDEDDEQLAATNLEHARDIEYVRDLGLIAARPPLRIANPIYAEVVQAGTESATLFVAEAVGDAVEQESPTEPSNERIVELVERAAALQEQMQTVLDEVRAVLRDRDRRADLVNEPIRIGNGVTPPLKIHDVPPVYPPAAREAGVQGLVILDATIDPTGVVGDVEVLKSVPELDDAAIAAVEQWRYEPTLVDGVPVSVSMTMTINFTLRSR